jgi:DNA-binding SARP family transcriptional activator
MAGEGDAAHRTIEKTLDISEKLGIHIYDFPVLAYGAYLALSTGDRLLSKRYLDRLEMHLSPHAVSDTAQFHHISTEAALLMKDWPGVKFHLDNAIRLSKICGMPLGIAFSLTLQASLYLVQELPQKAMAVLDRIMALDVPRHTGSIYFLNQLLRADCARIQHQKDKMIAHLKAAFADRAENGFILPIGIDRDRVAVLFAETITAGIETPIVKEFIERMKLTPPSEACADDSWPWSFKIYTLGRLEIFTGDHPIDLSGKPPKKTLELLKLLICSSGRPLSRDKIIDQLWPDTDGDRAVQNMKTALHRLRTLLGQSSSVLLKNSRLALNPEFCWVDAWHFESLVRLARSATTPDRQMEWREKAIAAYTGCFDGFSDGHALGIGYAQQLRNLWVTAVLSQARLLIGRGQMQAAQDLFRKALTMDETIESLYQELIALLYSQNRLAEGMFVFNRCQSMLKGRGLAPAKATMDLYSKLQKILARGS